MKIFKSLLLCTFLATASCNQWNDDDNDNEAPRSPAEAPAGVDPSNPYRAALSRLVAGRYAGACEEQPNGSAVQGEIAISESGQVTAPNATGSLTDEDMNLVFERKFSDTNVESLSYTAVDTSSDSRLYLAIESGNQASDNKVTAAKGLREAEGLSCSGLTQIDMLKTKSLFSTLAGTFRNTPTSLRCLGNNQVKTVSFLINPQDIRINETVYNPLAALKSETASVLTPHGTLVYLLDTQNQGKLSFNLNDKGEVDLLQFTDASGDEYNCAK